MIRHQLAFAGVLGLGLWSWASPITKFITIILIISPSAILPRQGSLVLVLPFDSLRPPFDPQLTASSSSKPKLSVLHKQDAFLKKRNCTNRMFVQNRKFHKQSKFLKSYKVLLHKSCSNFIFRICQGNCYDITRQLASFTAIKFTKRYGVSEWVSEWVSYWQALPMIGLGSDKKQNNPSYQFCLLSPTTLLSITSSGSVELELRKRK